jgi:hypothetical protein
MRRGLLLFFWLLSLCPRAFCAEFAVNTRTTYDQKDADVAADANGNFVVVWSSYRQDGDSGGVFGQRFGANGGRVGEEFQINTTTHGNQGEPAVAMGVDGRFIVVWHGPASPEDANEDIFARRFGANGAAVGDEFRVNSFTDGEQVCPRAAMNSDVNCVIVWESEGVPQVGKRGICGQRYDSSGTTAGSEFAVSDEASTWRYPDVGMDEAGGFVVTYIRDSSFKSVWVRQFEPNGAGLYLSSRVNDAFNFTSLTRPALAMDAGGNYVIAWDGHPDSYLEDDIYVKRYHRTHVPLHPQFRVNTTVAGAQCEPCVAISDDGDFVILWASETGVASTEADIIGQRFPSQSEHIGEPLLLGDEFRLNTYRADEQRHAIAAITGEGGFVGVWESYGQDGSRYGAFGAIGPVPGSPDIDGDGFVDWGDYCVLGEEWQRQENPLRADLVDDNKVDELDLSVLCGRWLRACYACGQADISGDGKVDLKDYALWAGDWPKLGPGLGGDITGDGVVDMADLKAVGFHWGQDCNAP